MLQKMAQKLKMWGKRFFPWLVISTAGLLCLAGFAVYYLYIYQPAQPTVESLEIVPSDTFNLLLALTDPDSHEPLAFLLIGLDAPDKQLLVMPLPGNLSVQKGKTLDNLFTVNGVSEASAACASLLGVPVDYHWVQNAPALAEVIDWYGGLNCDLPAAASARVPHGALVETVEGFQHLNGVKVEAAACYASYFNLHKKLAVQGALFQALLWEKCTGSNLDPDAFGDVFDLAHTNFSMNDLLSKSRSLEQAASAGKVRLLLPVFQSENTDTITFTAAFRTEIRQAFGKQNRVYGH